MARRGHGEGSVYRRQDGRWAASITLDDHKRKTFYGKSRKEVLEKLKVALHEQQQGTLATGPQQTLKQYLEQWLEEVHKPTIRLSSYAKYRKLLDNHILPALGHIQIQKLTPQQIQSFYTKKLKDGLSATTIHVIHAVLHNALENAVRWGIISRNACDVISPPRQTRHEIQPLTKEQVQQLLKKARGHRLEALLTVAVTTGMRRGELIGLKWQDIDLEERTLYIRRTVDRITKNGYVESEPKTAQSRRKVMLPLFVVEVLKQHRAHQEQLRQQAEASWQEHGLVFCNTHGGYFHPGHLYEMFQTLLRDAALPPMRFHDLRHSAASILLGMNVHPKVVQELLGHSQIGMTMDTYSHVLPSMQKDAMDKLDDYFT